MDSSYINRERIRQVVMSLRLIDDNFMKIFFEDKECTQFMLRIIMDMPQLQVTSVKTEYTLADIHGHSVRLDICATDDTGVIYNIEVQRNDSGAGELRARHNSSLIDANVDNPGLYGCKLPESYVIFITENDVLGKNLPIYHIDRVIRETGDIFDDKAHIIYVNNQIQDDTPLGRLMYDFVCTDPDKMSYGVLSSRTKFLKHTEEGVSNMCKAVEDLCREAARKAAREAAREAAAISREETEQAKNRTIAFKMFKAGDPDEKIIDYLEISQEALEGLRAEYNAG